VNNVVNNIKIMHDNIFFLTIPTWKIQH
jgi:hypothetical protein